LDFLYDKYKYSPEVLKLSDVEEYLEYIHNRFVLVPVDKAANNFAIICKRFYINTLMKELGFQNGLPKGNSVYNHSEYDLAGVCELHSKQLKDLNIRVTKENYHIPYLYWTSKQHKSPYKFRFIAGAKHCTTKQISSEVALALKCIKQQFRNYCRVIKKHSGISHFWSVDNSHEVVNKIKNIKAESLETYDFSTLYTNLPLDIIYKDLESLIIKMYRNSGSHTLLVNPQTKKCFWYQGNFYAGYKRYTIDKLLRALHFILNETYIQFGGFIFQQTLGIPMGGNASPFIADLFLAWREYKFITENIKHNFALVKALSNNSRYIDDILVLNHLDFGSLAKIIYPKQLILEKSSPFTKRENFLDLHIRVVNNVFVTGIYHKVDDFNFEVINFPFPESNIDTTLGYKTFYSQLVRFARLCSCEDDFYYRTQLTFYKLSKRGYDCAVLKKYFFRFCSKYNWVLEKYNHSSKYSFWEACLQFNKTISVKTCDTSSIKALTKELKMELVDLYADQKKGYTLKPCSIKLNKYDSVKKPVENITITEKHDTVQTPVENIPIKEKHDTIQTPMENITISEKSPENIISNTNPHQNSIILTAPIGISNPKNHCYINSVIQILLCIFYHHPQSFDMINDNEEGTILRYFKEILHTDFKFVYILKQHLAKYNPKLNGIRQQDANECFNILCNIFDVATKYSLLGDDNVEEAFICNFTKENFSHTIKTSTICTVCKTSSSTFSTSSVHVVTPKHNKNINIFISGSDMFTSCRSCAICNNNTIHQYSKEIYIFPKILIVLVNRFGYNNGVSVKNKYNILLDNRLILKDCAYELIGIIHHHGDSTASGHYTSWVKYNQFYVCNDIHTKTIGIHETFNTDTGYILIYNRT
jgi:ubiquitin C-terminal hydrolase